MNELIYAYRTAKAQGGFASCVGRVERGIRVYGTSYAIHPNRHQAYRYAKSIAKVQAAPHGAAVMHYDRINLYTCP